MSASVRVSSTGSVAARAAGVRSERATLTLRGSDEPPLHCQFNPSEYTISKSASWARVPVRGAVSAAVPEFVGTNAALLQVELFFDERASDSDSVSDSVQRLLSWTQPSPRSIDDNRPSPPVVAFEWGAVAPFDAYLSSASARFVLFRRDGSPIRAHVSLRLEEIPVILPGTNPTSASNIAVRHRTLIAGDSLAQIAFEEYGRADDWRAIARASGIEDPTRVSTGTTLVIPDAAYLAANHGRTKR